MAEALRDFFAGSRPAGGRTVPGMTDDLLDTHQAGRRWPGRTEAARKADWTVDWHNRIE